LGEEAKAIGRRVLVVTYPDIRRVGLLDRVLRDLEDKRLDTIVFDEVEPNPRDTTIDRAARIAHDAKVDLVIGLGGGVNLMFGAIAYENSDAFDAVSRSLSYVYARPWRLAFYTLLATVYGSISYLFVRLSNSFRLKYC
jgi:alcohol dehydrogenase class IV